MLLSRKEHIAVLEQGSLGRRISLSVPAGGP
jgi:hypothetical protein